MHTTERGVFRPLFPLLVGRERLELPVFLVLRVYSPLPSPLGIPAHIHLLLVGRAGIEPAVPRLKVVCLTTRLPAHMALPLPRKHYTSHCAATRHEYPDCLGRGFGGSPRSRTENLGVAVHCLSILAKEPDGTQSRSRTYVKGLEDPCTIRYTIRANVVGPLRFELRLSRL